MAVGDRLQVGAYNAANNATYDFKAAASGEALLQVIQAQAGKAVEVYWTDDGSHFTLLDTLSGGSVGWPPVRVSDTSYVRIINASGGVAGLWAVGVVTK